MGTRQLHTRDVLSKRESESQPYLAICSFVWNFAEEFHPCQGQHEPYTDEVQEHSRSIQAQQGIIHMAIFATMEVKLWGNKR